MSSEIFSPSLNQSLKNSPQTTPDSTDEKVAVDRTGKGSTDGRGGWLEDAPIGGSFENSDPNSSACSTDQCISVTDLMKNGPSRSFSSSNIVTLSESTRGASHAELTNEAETERLSLLEEHHLYANSRKLANLKASVPELSIKELRQQIFDVATTRQELTNRFPGLSGAELADAIMAIVTMDEKLVQLRDQFGQAVLRELAVPASDISLYVEKHKSVNPVILAGPEQLFQKEYPAIRKQETYPTDLQLELAAEALKQTPEFTDLAWAIDEGLAKLQLLRELEQPDVIHPELLGDRLTNAFVLAAGVDFKSLDPADDHVRLALAKQDPMLATLLEKSGILIEATHLKTVKVTINGEEVPLTQQQQAFAENQQYVFLGMSLLQTAHAQGLTQLDPKVQTLLDVLPGVRLENTESIVNALMENGQDLLAIRVLSANMNAAMSVDERALIWELAGQPHFNEAYFDAQIDVALNRDNSGLDPDKAGILADNVGRWVQDLVQKGAPASEVADIVLDRIKAKLDHSWYVSNDPEEDLQSTPEYGADDVDCYGVNRFFRESRDEKGEEFGRGLIKLVEITDLAGGQRADEIENWIFASSESHPIHAMGLKYVYQMTPTIGGGPGDSMSTGGFGGIDLSLGRPSLTESVFEKMRGSPLSESLLKLQLSRFSEEPVSNIRFNKHSWFANELAKSQKAFIHERTQELALKSYKAITADPESVVAPYFSSFMQGPDVTSAATYCGTELRNFIGRSMGMVPTDLSAAEANDNDREWYSDPAQNKVICVVEAWIKGDGGDEPMLSAIPMIYADPGQGVLNITLFQVKTEDGWAVLDSSMANIALNGPGGDAFEVGDRPNARMRYDNFTHFIEKNNLSEDGTLFVPQGTHEREFSFGDANGQLQYKALQASLETTGEKVTYYVDIGIGVVGAGVGILAAIPSSGQSLWLTYASLAMMGIGGARSGYELYAMNEYGQSLSVSNPEARAQYLSLGAAGASTGALKLMGSGARVLQTGQTLKFEAQMLQATGRSIDDVAATQRAAESMLLLKRAAVLEHSARGLSIADMGASGWVMGEQGYNVIKHWDELTPGQKAEAVAMIGLNVVPFGFGVATTNNKIQPDLLKAKAEAQFNFIGHQIENRPLRDWPLGEIGEIPTKNFRHLNVSEFSAEQWLAVRPEQIGVIPKEQIAKAPVHEFTPDQLKALTPEQVKTISAETIAKIPVERIADNPLIQDMALKLENDPVIAPQQNPQLAQGITASDIKHSLLGFESAAISAVVEKGQPKATAGQWKALLSKSGAKKDELDWMDANVWLDKQQGTIRKEDVLAYMDAHKIVLDEVILSDKPLESTVELIDVSKSSVLTNEEKALFETVYEYKTTPNSEERYRISKDIEGKYYLDFLPEGDSKSPQFEEIGFFNDFETAVNAIKSHHSGPNSNANKPEQKLYMIAGGINYKELLIIFPEIENVSQTKHYRRNEIVHVRFDERNIDGKKILFINEIQSDIHEKGRKKGYRDVSLEKDKIEKLIYESGQLREKINDINNVMDTIINDAIGLISSKSSDVISKNDLLNAVFEKQKSDDGSSRDNLLDKISKIISDNQFLNQMNNNNPSIYTKWIKIQSEYKLATDAQAKINTEIQNIRDIQHATEDQPNSPFKGNLWLHLGLKRMIKYANDHGFDGMAWARSDQIAPRVKTSPKNLDLLYNEMIKNYFNKYTKKWDGKVEYLNLIDESNAATVQARADQANDIVYSSDLPAPKKNDLIFQLSRLEVDLYDGKPIDSALERLSTEARHYYDQADVIVGPNQVLMLTDKMKAITTQKLAIRDGEIEGAYDATPMLITLSRVALNPKLVIRHETIHALKDLELFSTDEWATLEDAARAENWIGKHNVESLYGDRYTHNPDRSNILLEESIAMEFAAWRDGKGQPSSQIQAMFEKILEFFKELGVNLKREGIESYQDVFRKIEAGEIGQRLDNNGPGQPGAGADVPESVAEFARRVLPTGVTVEMRDQNEMR